MSVEQREEGCGARGRVCQGCLYAVWLNLGRRGETAKQQGTVGGRQGQRMGSNGGKTTASGARGWGWALEPKLWSGCSYLG